MVDPQTPVVKLGTKLKKGVVTGIFRGRIEVLGEVWRSDSHIRNCRKRGIE